MKNASKYLTIIVITGLIVLVAIRLFYNLPAAGIDDWDEGWHAVNAYEMFRSGNWVVNTYGEKVDYFNSKPPLSLWMIVTSFHIFGANFFALKFPSALFGFITCLMLSVFVFNLQKDKDNEQGVKGINGALRVSLFFIALFLILDILYEYHMFRTGNHDSLYVLCLFIGFIGLYNSRKDSRWLILLGAGLGLAFGAKSFHVTPFVLGTILSIPFISKKDRIRNILLSVVAAIAVNLPWAIPRFIFDGTAFFKQMLFGEANDKIHGFTYEFITRDLIRPIFILLYVTVLLTVILRFVHRRQFAESLYFVRDDLKNDAIFWIWIIVPVLFFSAAGTPSEWYIYACHIIAALLVAINAERVFEELSGRGRVTEILAITLSVCLVAGCTIHSIKEIDEYKFEGTGGGPSYPFWEDILTIKENYGDEYRGDYIYAQDVSRYNPDEEKDTLFCDLAAYAEIEYDMRLMEGGVEGWLHAEDGILMLNKELWDKYSSQLMGYVILHDNGYLYFTHDRYGE